MGCELMALWLSAHMECTSQGNGWGCINMSAARTAKLGSQLEGPLQQRPKGKGVSARKKIPGVDFFFREGFLPFLPGLAVGPS